LKIAFLLVSFFIFLNLLLDGGEQSIYIYIIAFFTFFNDDRAITSKSGTLKGYRSVHGKCEFSSSYKPLLTDTSKEMLKKLAKGKGTESMK
jgi:hypothetical protein